MGKEMRTRKLEDVPGMGRNQTSGHEPESLQEGLDELGGHA